MVHHERLLLQSLLIIRLFARRIYVIKVCPFALFFIQKVWRALVWVTSTATKAVSPPHFILSLCVYVRASRIWRRRGLGGFISRKHPIPPVLILFNSCSPESVTSILLHVCWSYRIVIELIQSEEFPSIL